MNSISQKALFYSKNRNCIEKPLNLWSSLLICAGLVPVVIDLIYFVWTQGLWVPGQITHTFFSTKQSLSPVLGKEKAGTISSVRCLTPFEPCRMYYKAFPCTVWNTVWTVNCVRISANIINPVSHDNFGNNLFLKVRWKGDHGHCNNWSNDEESEFSFQSVLTEHWIQKDKCYG